ncbi:putative aryl-alcohol dehydrogenase Aad16p [Monosporozyma servazzii]
MSLVKQVPFGQTGIKISPIIVGCMSYGDPSWRDWVMGDEEKIFEILKFCYDNGLRTFDTSDVYSNGKSERILGKFLKKYNIKRETVVIMTKVFFPVDEELADMTISTCFDKSLDTPKGVTLANQRGLSRKHIIAGVQNSMERLGTYIDVLQIHRLDHDTPMKDIMKTLNWVVEQGYTRYIGASSMLATEFVELQMIADKYNWFQFVNLQTQYSLIYREDERELIPFAKRHGLAMTPWSPNAAGKLTRPYKDLQSTTRGRVDVFASPLDDASQEIINRVEKVANKHNVPMAVVSTAWVLSKGFCPIVGMSGINRVEDAIQATQVKLTEEDIQYLEEPYRPRNLLGV